MGSVKLIRMKEEMINADCIGLGEINRNWYRIKAQDSLHRRIKHWWKHQRTNITWLRDSDWPYETQQGGVSLTLASNKIAKYGQETGDDSAGLGRWCWQTIEGHSEIKTAVIQIYRPPRNAKDNGSTFRQQQAAAGELDPIKIFDEDLLEMLDTFIEDNFRIILMGDFNLPLKGKSKLEKDLNERGLFDVIQTQFGYDSAPNTYARGSQPIDAIFATETIEVIRAGYDRGFKEISDHRAVWADFSMGSLLGVDRGDITKPKAKKLQVTNRVRTLRFNKKFMEQIILHKVLNKARELEEQIGENDYMTPEQEVVYETVDEQRLRATRCAEEQCVKLPADDAPFSEAMKKATGMLVIRNQIKKKMMKNERVHVRWIIDLKKEFHIDSHIDIPRDKEQAIQEAQQAYEKYKEAKERSPELRSEFLDLLIQQAEDRGNDEKAKQIREIKEKEQQKDAHNRIKYARGKTKGGGVKFVHRVSPEGQIETIKNKLEMELEIARANEEKLMAANESPIRQGELKEVLSDHNYDRWEQFLQGNIEIPETDRGTELWLKTFKGTTPAEDTINITTEDYVKSWGKTREHTSCAPGHLHFGTFKAMKWCRPAAELHTILARIPIKTGYTPKRWAASTDSMLPKKPGEWRPSKLRLTSLLQPDYNHNNKILGRIAMKKAEEKGLLAPEQYGSRKKLSAEKHALNKRLLLDILRMEKRPGVLCANDAKSCYDRILHFAAYISLRRVGLPKQTVISMLEPIRTMEHRVRTAYGDAEITYGGDKWSIDPSGICQGNGAGPAIWALVSSPLFDCLREQGYGANLTSAISRTYINLTGFAFVDDTDTIQTGEKGQKPEEVLAEAQEQLQLWEQLIRATGGGIDGDKSDFAVVGFEWAGGKWSYRKKQEEDKLVVRNGDKMEPLTQLGPSEARRTLGVWQAIDGNERKQTEKMKEKAEEWARAVARSSLTRRDTILGAKTSLYPSITFGLMATTLSKEQGKEIFKPIRKGVLGKAGYNRSMPETIVHGPETYGGIGLKDIYSLQGISHIKTFLDEAGTNSPTGKLMGTLIEGHTVEVGKSGSIFQQPYKKIEQYMTTSWMKHTMEFMDTYKFRIQGHTHKLRTWRENDSMLMDDIERKQGVYISIEEKQAFQRCRLFLQVNTLSDITNGQGTNILEAAWECKKQWEPISGQAYSWPHQTRPSKADRQRWKKVLTLLYDVDNRDYTIGRRLGKYNKHSRQHAAWVIDKTNESLYNKEQGVWRRWKLTNRRNRHRVYQPTSETIHTIERRWRIATVLITHNGASARYNGSREFIRDTPRTSDTDSYDSDETTTDSESEISPLVATVKRTPKSLRWAVERCKLPKDHGKAIAEKIIKGDGKCMSDGSTKDGLGTAAAIPVGVDEEDMYMVLNRTPGDDIDIHSFRSELTGILANVLVVKCIIETHQVQDGRMTLACDNESALWACFGDDEPTAGDASCDILKVIRHEIKQSTIKWQAEHVRGHQDRGQDVYLDEWAVANIEADRLAGEYWAEKYRDGTLRRRPITTIMPGERWRVYAKTTPIVTKIDDQMYEHIHYDGCMKYWEKKSRLAPNRGGEVEWGQYKGALKLIPPARRQWTQKHFTGFEGTNAMMFNWGKRTTNTCPNCALKETHRHIMQCQSTRATVAYRNIERNFESWLKMTTSRDIRLTIMAHLDAYREQEEIEEPDDIAEDVQYASRKQRRIGPNAFAEGLLVDTWQHVQKRYLNDTQSQRCPSRWIRELIKKLWQVSWDMWDSRNGAVHRNPETRKDVIIAQLDKEIEDAHHDGTTNQFMPRLERMFFRVDVEAVLEKTEYQKRTWLHMANRFIERDRQRVVRNKGTQLLREWLQPGSTVNTINRAQQVKNKTDRDIRAPEGSRRGPLGRRE